MPSLTLCILVLLAIAVSIFVNWKLNINLGIVAACFAYVIGSFIMQLKTSVLVDYTPIKVVFQLVSISMFFSFPVQNGTVDMLVNHLLYKVRNYSWFLPFALFLIGTILGFLGAPPPAACAIMAALSHSIAKKAGFHPMLAVLASVLSGVGADVPYGATGTIMSNTIEELGMSGLGAPITWKFFFADLGLYLIAMIIYYVALKGFNVKYLTIERPEPATKEQKLTLTIILIMIGLVLLPNLLSLIVTVPVISFAARFCDIQMLAIVGVLLFSLLKLGNTKEAIQKGVPWNTVIMISGICILIGVAQEAGAVNLLSGLITQAVPPLLICPTLCICGAFLSFFSGAINVVFPLLAALVPGITAVTALSPTVLCIAIGVGAFSTSISPFSTGGAMAMSMCPDDSMHKQLFVGQLGVAGVNTVLALILSFLLGLF